MKESPNLYAGPVLMQNFSNNEVLHIIGYNAIEMGLEFLDETLNVCMNYQYNLYITIFKD